jgi:pre-mRNA 3'-end-processing factor FIP1
MGMPPMGMPPMGMPPMGMPPMGMPTMHPAMGNPGHMQRRPSPSRSSNGVQESWQKPPDPIPIDYDEL